VRVGFPASSFANLLAELCHEQQVVIGLPLHLHII
jgi:hypothetical protein